MWTQSKSGKTLSACSSSNRRGWNAACRITRQGQSRHICLYGRTKGSSWLCLFSYKHAFQICEHLVPLTLPSLRFLGHSCCFLYSTETSACREDERLKRIRDEGYDRYAPITETNRPPNAVPSKRPPVDDDSD